MINKNALAAVSLISASVMLAACDNRGDSQQGSETVLWNFESGQIPAAFQLENAKAELVTSDENSALKLTLDSTVHYEAGFTIAPEIPWNWSDLGNFAFALDIANPEPSSVHLYVKATDASGKVHNRNIQIAENSAGTYYMELKGPDLMVETGMRGNPPSWDSSYQDIIWRWGDKQLDLNAIKSIQFSVTGVLENKTLIVDNLRLITPGALDEHYLKGLVDEFGQNAKRDFVNKVASVAQLREIASAEQAQLRDTPLPGRSRFGGWADGPRLEATGFFRTEKFDGKWTLVDPDGYLFFSSGIANVRLANTSTITGYDIDQSAVPQRKEQDLTPEDSAGLNRVPTAAVTTRYVSSPLRAEMFNWLPSYESPQGDNFGYRREVHTGAVKHGETFSFYRANLQRKYGFNENEELMAAWRETTLDRMLTWGFTSFGNWIDPGYYAMDRIPYFANGWIIGDFKTVSSGNDYWSPLPDPFDPEFVKRANITAQQIADEVNGNPWCAGVFVDNEKSWGQEGSIASQYGVVINTLNRPADESPSKAQFVELMRNKYADIVALNRSWETDIVSWEALAEGIELTEFTDAMVIDFSAMLELYADRYFQVVRDAVKQYMPNHLYMGARFASWGMTPEIRRAAAEYADVVSYNYYKEGVRDQDWPFLAELDRPSIIGEFHNGALDSGLVNPGLIHASSQADRGKKYAEYMHSVIDNPYLVGAHWFQYIDSPLTGRAYDGENYNIGFVSVTDIPYQPLVDAATAVNRELYPRRFGTMLDTAADAQ